MRDGALVGIRVVELGGMVSAPYCAKLLADFGADVVKVEPPQGGDVSRSWGPFPNDEPHPEKSGLFQFLNTNKRSVTLDLETSAGRDTRARGTFVEVEHPLGFRETIYGAYVKLSRSRPSATPGPSIGQDNEYVFKQLLGLSEERYREMVERQVIY